MRKKKIRWCVVFLLLAAGISGLWLTTDMPPIEEMEATRKKISEAEKLNAEIYMHHLYEVAKIQYDSAMLLWKAENEKLFFFRTFKYVRELAFKSADQANLAIKKAQEIQQNTRKEAQEEMALLRQEMKQFEKVFVALPLGRKVIGQHSRGKLLLNEAEIAFEKGEYNVGRQKVQEAAKMIRTAYLTGHKMLDHYFKKLPLWQEQLEKFIEQSRKNEDYGVVVVKIPATCIIYYNGKQKYSFPVEFGKNWLGDKHCEGDYATPEGEYHIIKRLQEPMTRYYKALLLDYPNAEDRACFERLKKNGTLSRNARPGSLIEIHGEGGRGGNWTNGCVALENKDMSILYRSVSKGTPVLIIGAEKEFRDRNEK